MTFLLSAGSAERQPGGRRRLQTAFPVALVVLCLMQWACSPEPALRLSGGWIREAPPGSMHLAGYFELHNYLAETVTLTGASSASFASVEFHETRMENGVARMRPTGDIPIRPGETLSLQPGAMHLMLMNPSRELGAGVTVTLVLHFADRADLRADLPVRKAGD